MYCISSLETLTGYPDILSGTLRIRQGWSELELRVGGLGSVRNDTYNNRQNKQQPSIRSVS